MADRQQRFQRSLSSLRVLSRSSLRAVSLAVMVCALNGWAAAEEQQQDRALLRFYTDGTASIDVRNVALSSLLNYLRNRHGITVVIPDFTDRLVTLSASQLPLTFLLEKVLQPDERFWIVSERDLVIPNREISRRGLKPNSSREKPRKGDSDYVTEQGERMSAPAEIKPVATDGASGTMKSPVQIVATASASRPDDEIPPSMPQQNYGRLWFRWDGDQITPISMAILPGEYAFASGIKGDYLYVIRIGEEVVAVESFQDPRRIHSYYPETNRPHEVIEAQAGNFAVSIPDAALAVEALSRMTVGVYRLDGQPPTWELSPGTFANFERVLERLFLIEGYRLEALFKTDQRK